MARATTPGFTLVEMLAALAIIGLVSGLGFPRVERALEGQRTAAAGAEVELALNLARAEAIGKGLTVRVVSDGPRIGSAGRPVVRSARSEVRLPGQGLSFFGDGSSTGGVVTVGTGKLARRLEIDAPSGAIRVVS